MFAMQYSHRLPSDYNMAVIQHRAQTRGHLWDDTPGLIYKAFVAQRRGQCGAKGNVYASVYLWQDVAEASRFITGERFENVIDTFGKPEIDTWLPLDARRGAATSARTLYRETVPISAAANLRDASQIAIAENRRVAELRDTVAVWTALDVRAWQWVRFTLSADAPDMTRASTIYEILYLAEPKGTALPV